jgi:DNA topoisomerase-1
VACSGFPACKFTKPHIIKVGVKCPECGSEIIQRLSKKRRTFYGCASYPKCKFISSFKPLAKPCPQCKGLLTQHGKQEWCTKCEYKGKIEEAKSEEKT